MSVSPKRFLMHLVILVLKYLASFLVCPHRANKFISTWHSLAWMLKWQMKLGGEFIFSVAAATFLMYRKLHRFLYINSFDICRIAIISAHLYLFLFPKWTWTRRHLPWCLVLHWAIKRRRVEMAQKSRSFAVRFLIFVLLVVVVVPDFQSSRAMLWELFRIRTRIARCIGTIKSHQAKPNHV